MSTTRTGYALHWAACTEVYYDLSRAKDRQMAQGGEHCCPMHNVTVIDHGPVKDATTEATS